MTINNDRSHLLKGIDAQRRGTCGSLAEVSNEKTVYPISVVFILGIEFAERFSFYGVRTILVIYLTRQLGMRDDTATSMYHMFEVICYCSSLLGAMLADGWIGRYKTILYFSILYTCGNLIMATTAIPPPHWLGPAIGLLIIGLASGGIKPCVSAFGGDQFNANQTSELNRYFSLYYWLASLGSLLTTWFTPMLRSQVHCYGTTCYPLAFGFPAIIMLIAFLVFFFGRHQYKTSPPPGDNLVNSCKCIGRAIVNKIKRKGERKDHWLSYADDVYEKEFIADVKCVLHVSRLCLTLPMFWALRAQLGSRWTLQATKMDLSIGSWTIQPDQIQVINPVLIMLFIPLFDTVVYPLLDGCSFSTTPLKKIGIGMIAATIAFLLAGFLQLKLESEGSPNDGLPETMFINTDPCSEDIHNLGTNYTLKVGIANDDNYVQCVSPNASYESYCILPMKNSSSKDERTLLRCFEHAPNYRLSYLIFLNSDTMCNNTFTSLTGKCIKEACPPPLRICCNTTVTGDTKDISEQAGMENAAIYEAVAMNGSGHESTIFVFPCSSVDMNGVHWAYQIPQYVLITVAEMLIVVTCFQFGYTQAPPSMKSVVLAIMFLMVASGNAVDVIVAAVAWLPSQSAEFFMFAALMLVNTLTFAAMAYSYGYVYRFDSII